ncbi:MAG: prepilin peptidase [Eisenbergiella sp.]
MEIQAALFLFLLLAVSICDLKWREIPDRLQLSIAALTFLCFSPGNLTGVFGALPYLVVALFFPRMEGMGGGDIKLAAATGVVLGLPASLAASCWDCRTFILEWSNLHTYGRFRDRRKFLPVNLSRGGVLCRLFNED